MDTSFGGGRWSEQGGTGFGHGFGGSFNPGDLWETLGQLRKTFEQKVGTRVGRGDVRSAILTLLAERPMHGYQLIQEIEERSGGTWKPSPGSVYPTLQLLTDEGLVVADEAGGRKTYSLTDAGRAEAEGTERPAPWDTEQAEAPRSAPGTLAKAGAHLAQAAAQVARTGTPAQVEEAVAVLDEARRKLYAILAQD